jgi:hypothetical protein
MQHLQHRARSPEIGENSADCACFFSGTTAALATERRTTFATPTGERDMRRLMNLMMALISTGALGGGRDGGGRDRNLEPGGTIGGSSDELLYDTPSTVTFTKTRTTLNAVFGGGTFHGERSRLIRTGTRRPACSARRARFACDAARASRASSIKRHNTSEYWLEPDGNACVLDCARQTL